MFEFDMSRLQRRKPEPAKALHMFPGWELLHHSAPREVSDNKDLTWNGHDTIELHPCSFDNHYFDLTITWVEAFNGWGLLWGDTEKSAIEKHWNFGLAWSACECVRERNVPYEQWETVAIHKIHMVENLGIHADSLVNLSMHEEVCDYNQLIRASEHVMMRFLSELESFGDTWWGSTAYTRELRDKLLGENWSSLGAGTHFGSLLVKRLGDIWRQPNNKTRQ